MTSVRIKPAGARDLAMHRAQYDELVAALHESGHDAEIDEWERRDAWQVVHEIAVHVGEDGVAVAIVEFLKQYLRGLRRPPSGEPRRAVIYGRTAMC